MDVSMTTLEAVADGIVTSFVSTATVLVAASVTIARSVTV